jgi:hypothetical protein
MKSKKVLIPTILALLSTSPSSFVVATRLHCPPEYEDYDRAPNRYEENPYGEEEVVNSKKKKRKSRAR